MHPWFFVASSWHFNYFLFPFSVCINIVNWPLRQDMQRYLGTFYFQSYHKDWGPVYRTTYTHRADWERVCVLIWSPLSQVYNLSILYMLLSLFFFPSRSVSTSQSLVIMLYLVFDFWGVLWTILNVFAQWITRQLQDSSDIFSQSGFILLMQIFPDHPGCGAWDRTEGRRLRLLKINFFPWYNLLFVG